MLTLGKINRLGQEHPPLPMQTLASALNGPLGNQMPPQSRKPSFNTMQADCDINIKLMYIRSHIGVTMEALAESLPSYSDKDFLMVHRKNNKGLWKDEL